jgi:hypothetical protein
MKLKHLGSTVTDTVAARNFLEKDFGLEGIGKSNATMTHPVVE